MIGITIGQIQAIPFIIGGISLFFRLRVGPYWIAWSMIATFILAVVNTWVLLVEILQCYGSSTASNLCRGIGTGSGHLRCQSKEEEVYRK